MSADEAAVAKVAYDDFFQDADGHPYCIQPVTKRSTPVDLGKPSLVESEPGQPPMEFWTSPRDHPGTVEQRAKLDTATRDRLDRWYRAPRQQRDKADIAVIPTLIDPKAIPCPETGWNSHVRTIDTPYVEGEFAIVAIGDDCVLCGSGKTYLLRRLGAQWKVFTTFRHWES